MMAVITVKKCLVYWVLDHFVEHGDKNNLPRSFFYPSFVQIAHQLFVLYNSGSFMQTQLSQDSYQTLFILPAFITAA